MHAARISGGDVSNIISGRAEALLDIQLAEHQRLKIWQKICGKRALRASAMKSVSASTPVVMSEDNPQILAYKRLAEQVTGRKIVFEQIGRDRCAAFCGKRGDGDNAFRYGRGHACRRRYVNLAVGRKSWHGFRLNT